MKLVERWFMIGSTRSAIVTFKDGDPPPVEEWQRIRDVLGEERGYELYRRSVWSSGKE